MHNFLKYIIVIAFMGLFSIGGFSQMKVKWQETVEDFGVKTEKISENKTIQYLHFKNAAYIQPYNIPSLVKHFQDLHFDKQNFNILKQNFLYEKVNEKESTFLEEAGFADTASIINIQNHPSGGIYLEIIPFRKNTGSGYFERLKYVEIEFEIVEKPVEQQRNINRFVSNSVLRAGQWHQLKITNTGVYKITYDELLSWGITPDLIDPETIQLFKGQNGMLPEANDEQRQDDLIEIPLLMDIGNDGSFDSGDFFLFYGISPHIWQLTHGGIYEYTKHLYDDFNYYYLTYNQNTGQRMQYENLPQDPENISVNAFNTFRVLENDLLSLAHSGKMWLDEEINQDQQLEHSFLIPGLVPEADVKIILQYAHNNESREYMEVMYNSAVIDTISLNALNNQWVVARAGQFIFDNITEGEEINIGIRFIEGSGKTQFWLDKITLNTWQYLTYFGEQFIFSNSENIAPELIKKYNINSSADLQVWNVSDPTIPSIVPTERYNEQFSFKFLSDTVYQFAAFNTDETYTVNYSGEIENQNLHASASTDLLIISHPDFLQQAERLAQLHVSIDSLSVLVVTPQQIYHEFSGGKQDPSALRDFCKLIYDSAPEGGLRYLLLMGDGSFDPKDRIEGNTNFIPTFQTEESFDETVSYVMEDFFGFLEDDEGENGAGDLDIGIGRLPVKTPDEAKAVIDKIENYMTGKTDIWGNWQTKVCFVADDEEGNLFFRQCDTISNRLGRNYSWVNINKIYFDHFVQEETTSGSRYPGAKQALNKQVNDGALIVNYIGHGGERGWSAERVLEIADINSWQNFNQLPLFITATCEFSRFDNPLLTAGGELVLLNPDGGGIGLITTTRLSYAGSNYTLNKKFFEIAFEKSDGEYPRLGDLIRGSKPISYSTKNIVLLGDPALRLAYPELEIKTTYINDQSIGHSFPDTLNPMELVTVKGFVKDHAGDTANYFNGILFPVVFDKPNWYATLNNDGSAEPVLFQIQDKYMFKGHTEIINGKFTFQFIVPADIQEEDIVHGKISYFGFSENQTAGGSNEDFLIGGINTSIEEDNIGPEITIFLDEETFQSGDLVKRQPTLIAYLEDVHGINTSNLSIGHDITAFIDNYTYQYMLNDVFVPEINSYSKGQVVYPLDTYEDGIHSITVKAFDNYNNVSENTVLFKIAYDSVLIISQVQSAPNPMRDRTLFSFNHPRPGEKLDISLKVFNLQGALVYQFNEQILAQGISTNFLEWDGRNNNGQLLENGMYIYQVIVQDQREGIFSQSQRLIISR